ncbi:hypothetical protein QYF36_023256 [Acer negundo]|nr:hypothetical protein QYF36_023256 [Acer negundo]
MLPVCTTEQIIQVVKYLDERLKELDEEKEELRKYQQLDKQRKSLEYTIYDKELHDARQKLAEAISMIVTVINNGTVSATPSAEIRFSRLVSGFTNPIADKVAISLQLNPVTFELSNCNMQIKETSVNKDFFQGIGSSTCINWKVEYT